MKYAAKRVLMLLVTMVIVSFLTFLAFDMISGDPATAMLGTEATPEKVAALQEELGLNRPFPVRYGEWLLGFFTGDLGTSYNYKQPVRDLIGPKVLVTLCLSVLSFLLITVVSIPLGLWSARRAGGRLDGARTSVNQLCMAVPPFFTGILLSWVFGVMLHWFVPGSFPGLERFGSALKYLLFAAVAIAIPRIAMTVKMLRSSIQTQLQQDYVRTSRSRGSGRSKILRRHVLKNALIPVITFLAVSAAEIMTGSIIVEQVFTIPGISRLLLASISNRDFPVVQAIVVVVAAWIVIVNFVADLLYQLVDPRIRLR